MQHEPKRRVQNAAELLSAFGRIHERLTSETPEQVMRKLLETPAGAKVVVGTRPVWPLRIAAGMAAAAVTGAAVWYLMPNLPDFGAPAAHGTDTVTVVVPAPAPPPETVTVALAPSGPARALAAPRPVAVPQPGAATVPAAAPAPAARTPLELAAERHGTSDAMEIVRRELRAGSYASVLALFEYLPADRKVSTEARLYRLRALSGAGRTAQLRQALDEGEIADGEYWLTKARAAHEAGRSAEALGLLDRGSALPRMLMEYDEYKRESGYCRARSATALFDQSPGEETYKRALDAWYELRLALRADPGHAYNTTVQAEIQRIGQKRRETAGGAE